MALQLTRLTFFAAPGQPGAATTVTILVGPNNSGKSLALREIAAWASGEDSVRQVIDEIDLDWPADAAAAEALLEPLKTEPPAGQPSPVDAFFVSRFKVDGSQEARWIHRTHLDKLQRDARSAPFRLSLSNLFTARLDGRTRFALVDERPWQDQQIPPQHHLAALFMNDGLRSRVRELVAAAFPGRYFVIDPTGMGRFRVRVSDRPPADAAEERNWDERSQSFHAAAVDIQTQSDGVICFTGLVAAAISLSQMVLLVDEPEAFLHPPLARLLGTDLASQAAERGASLVAATHSAEFVMGCIESGADTTIVRLTFESQSAGARVLPAKELQKMMLDPLLRSTSALSGLFHRGVIVGESDHDRAFYAEINRRLVAHGRGTPDTFFANAQNWQTIPRVVGPLRQVGVAAAAIIDLDTTVTGAKAEWRKFYAAVGVDQTAETALEAMRATTAGPLRAQGKNADGLVCKRTGLAAVSAADRARAQTYFAALADVGIFVVTAGELESWLPALGVSRSAKAKWIVDMFKALGSNPKGKAYVAPAAGDVWDFLDSVGAWIADPSRGGMP